MSNNIILPQLSLEEVLTHDAEFNKKIYKHKNVWWCSFKPFFCSPAWHLTSLKPGESWAHPLKSLGGYYHIVPPESYYNAILSVHIMNDLKGYSIENLSYNVRRFIRLGLRKVEIRPISKLEDLLTDGYDVYLSWKYRIKVDKSQNLIDPDIFKNWAIHDFNFPGKLFLGAYLDNRLVAFIMAYAVEDMAYIDRMFSHTEFHRFYPVEALLHSFIIIAQNSPGITKVSTGLSSLERDKLNTFKIRHGFEKIQYPVYVKLNPVVKLLLNCLKNSKLNKIMVNGRDKNSTGLRG